MLMIILKTKTHIFLLDLYLNIKLISFYQQHKKSNMKKIIRKTCEKIQKHFYYDNISRNFIIDKK